ncbi:PAS domain S-box-containing protein [Pseudomonas sp. BP8]|nr:PAS domain S-box-containing protein [Pseudomonas sp. BP8]
MVDKGNEFGALAQVVHLASGESCDAVNESISRYDWSKTQLGALPHWPPALRIAVDMMLLSPFPSALVWGTDLTVIHNDAYLSVLTGPDPVLGRAFDTLWSDHWPAIGPWVFKALAGKAGFVDDAPVSICLPYGSGHAWYAFSYTPVRDDQGQVAGFLHTVIDTTESVETIDAWRKRALAFEEQIARSLADRDHIWQLSHDAMIVVSPELRLQAANPAWCRMLGWHEGQTTGMAIIDLVHPADRLEVSSAALDVLQGRGADQVETRLRHRDGHYRWFRWSARREGDMLTAVGRDISQEREDALRQTETLLRNSQRMGAVGQLAGGMAHEMNNLLSGIGGSLELLQWRLVQGRLERIDNYVQLARDSVQRAMTLTHRLLAFSKNQPLSPKPLEINHQLLALEPLLLQTLGPEMHLQWQLDVAPWRVRLDPCQLENALINLCANARDACVPSGTLIIRSTNQRLTAGGPADKGLPAGDYVTLQFDDDGQGMTTEDVARAFEPFFTTKPVGRGAGLGLSMVYGFVHQSQGHVWIESTLEQGTRVTLMFPRCLEEPEQIPLAEPVQALAAGRGGRLLLIDDETNLRHLMKEALVDHGFEVCDVADANAAMAQFRHGGEFDVVITDIGLPGGFSGRQLAKAMRMLQPQQKILFITGFTDQPVEQHLLNEPGTALMLKPFSLKVLVGQVQQLLTVE